MSTKKDDEILKELQSKAAKWVEEKLPERMGGVGVDEAEVRKQLEIEAGQWVQYNVDQRRQGKEGTSSPDFHLYEEKPGYVPTVGPSGKDVSDMSDEDC
jgi:hypothetical protein